MDKVFKILGHLPPSLEASQRCASNEYPQHMFFPRTKKSTNTFRLKTNAPYLELRILQSNLDGSNTDGSFTMANSNSFLSPYEIFPIAQEGIFLFYREIVCCVYSLELPN